MKNNAKGLSMIATTAISIMFLVSTAFAVPQAINYQGYMEDSGGTPVNTTVSMTFSIYNAPTNGTALWTETKPSVTVTDGAFSVALGSVTPITLSFDEQYYLGVNVNGNGEMSPRAVLVSVPYAMRAGVADTALSADTAVSAQTANTANSANSANTAVMLEDKTLSQLVSLLDGRYGGVNALVADFSGTPVEVLLGSSVDFTDLSQGSPISWSWDFGDTVTSTLQNPSHTYTSDGIFTVSLTVDDGVTQNSKTVVDYITVLLIGNITTVDATGNVGMYSAIANGTDGLPIVAYFDGTNTDLKVVHCGDAACASGNTISTVDSGPEGIGHYPSIAIGADGFPVISYYENSYQDLRVLHCGNAACTTGNVMNVVDDGTLTGAYSSIAIGADNLPVISYKSGGLKVAHCGIANCASGNTLTTVDPMGGDQGTSIAIGTDGMPFIAYYNNVSSDLMLVHCGDAACSSGNTIMTMDEIGSVGLYPSIAIGADGLPIVSYYDNTNSALKVLHCGDVVCSSGVTVNTVDSAGAVGLWPSLAIGSDDLPIISYYDNTNSDIKVVHCGNFDCSLGNTFAVLDAGFVGDLSSITIGADGLPVISYYNSILQDLKVAHCADVACTLW